MIQAEGEFLSHLFLGHTNMVFILENSVEIYFFYHPEFIILFVIGRIFYCEYLNQLNQTDKWGRSCHIVTTDVLFSKSKQKESSA